MNDISAYPRNELIELIKSNNTQEILKKAGVLHGHFCPGLAIGVMASVLAMNRIHADSDGLEDLVAITETNNCFSDGVQFVTGCTFGNNALIFKDEGKVAFTLARRNGKGIRVISRPEGREEIKKVCPEFSEVYKEVVGNRNHDKVLLEKYKQLGVKRAFGVLQINPDKMFYTREVNVKIPEYAPSHESYICDACGESTMSTRTIIKNTKTLCFRCAEHKINILTGHGIV